MWMCLDLVFGHLFPKLQYKNAAEKTVITKGGLSLQGSLEPLQTLNSVDSLEMVGFCLSGLCELSRVSAL